MSDSSFESTLPDVSSMNPRSSGVLVQIWPSAMVVVVLGVAVDCVVVVVVGVVVVVVGVWSARW
jgi:hypothetical protein